MSLAWFGPASTPSGIDSSTRRLWIRSGAWPLLWSLRLIGWLSAPLLWSFTPPSIGRSRRRRDVWLLQLRRPRPLRRRSFHSWRQELRVTICPRRGQPHLVTTLWGHESHCHYGLRAARMALISEGVEATDPVIEWLWQQQEVIGEH